MKYKTVLAGCGSMGTRWLEYALKRNDVDLVALVDVQPEKALEAMQRFGLKLPVYEAVAEAVASEGVDLLLDTSIPEAHAANAITAMEHGANVMMEKPMALSMEDAVRLINVSDRTGRSCAVMQNRRYTKEIRALKAELDAGRIGPPGFVTADFFLGPRFGGFREMMAHPLLIDMAIHTFDAARYLIGSDPMAVYCHEFNPDGSWYQGNSSAVCIFEFSCGAVFSYNGSWSAVGHSTSWEGAWRLVGPKGTMLWDGDHEPVYEGADALESASAAGRQGSWYGPERREACLDEMFDSLKSGKRSETDISHNIHSLAMTLGAVESAKRQAKVWLPELSCM